MREVQAGRFCATQGALKNAGNVSTSLWTLVIAIHTFTLVFLKVHHGDISRAAGLRRFYTKALPIAQPLYFT